MPFIAVAETAFFFNFLFFMRVSQLTVVIVSGTQQRDSAIRIYMYISSWSSSENATEQESKFVFFLILKNVVKLILIWTQAEHIILGSRNPSLDFCPSSA